MVLTQAELDSFTGSENLYSHWLGIKYTEGVKYLATKGEAFWLLDAIASHQTKQLLAKASFQDFQLWELTVSEDKEAVMTCREDTTAGPAVRQEIPYTDFPLAAIKLYLVQKVLLLPSEY